jgi:hypothetical protein
MTENSGADIEKVIASVKRAIRATQQIDGGTQSFNVEKLELTLKGMIEKGSGGELKVRIPIIDTSLGTKVEITDKELQTIQLTLVPNKPTTRSGISTDKIEKELVEAIKVIRESVRIAASGEPKFSLLNASVELNFVVKKGGEIAFLAKGSGQSEVTQTVKLFLGPV